MHACMQHTTYILHCNYKGFSVAELHSQSYMDPEIRKDINNVSNEQKNSKSTKGKDEEYGNNRLEQ